MREKRKNQSSFFFILILFSCSRTYTPKPADYIRIDFPEKKYILCDSTLPYRFEYPAYCYIKSYNDKVSQPFWINIVYPTLNGTLYIDYKKIKNNLATLSEDAHALAYKHTIKAESIDETRIHFKNKKVYGIIYDIQGNAATSLQFYITDSTENFLRGSLYFNAHPNKDSLAPVLKFCREDVLYFIETFEWKELSNKKGI